LLQPGVDTCVFKKVTCSRSDGPESANAWQSCIGTDVYYESAFERGLSQTTFEPSPTEGRVRQLKAIAKAQSKEKRIEAEDIIAVEAIAA